MLASCCLYTSLLLLCVCRSAAHSKGASTIACNDPEMKPQHNALYGFDRNNTESFELRLQVTEYDPLDPTTTGKLQVIYEHSRWHSGLAHLQQWLFYLQGPGFESHLRPVDFFLPVTRFLYSTIKPQHYHLCHVSQ